MSETKYWRCVKKEGMPSIAAFIIGAVYCEGPADNYGKSLRDGDGFPFSFYPESELWGSRFTPWIPRPGDLLRYDTIADDICLERHYGGNRWSTVGCLGTVDISSMTPLLHRAPRPVEPAREEICEGDEVEVIGNGGPCGADREINCHHCFTIPVRGKTQLKSSFGNWLVVLPGGNRQFVSPSNLRKIGGGSRVEAVASQPQATELAASPAAALCRYCAQPEHSRTCPHPDAQEARRLEAEAAERGRAYEAKTGFTHSSDRFAKAQAEEDALHEAYLRRKLAAIEQKRQPQPKRRPFGGWGAGGINTRGW